MKLTLIVLMAGLTGFYGCSNTGTKKDTASDSVAAADSIAKKPRVTIADSVKGKMLANYLQLKNALVASDSVAAGTAASALAVSLAKVPGCSEAVTMASKIKNGGMLAGQRSYFAAINEQVIPMLKSADVTTGRIYVQYCPMANDGKGASWLSSEKHIRNPYYGDEMLECGEVKHVID